MFSASLSKRGRYLDVVTLCRITYRKKEIIHQTASVTILICYVEKVNVQKIQFHIIVTSHLLIWGN
jgi:hypothetical protein